jgi:hypothetical protein
MNMSTLIYSVREDRSEQIGQSEQDRRQVDLVIILVAAAIGPGLFLVDRLVGTVAWRSFLTEALSLCLYAATAVWYALRARTGVVWRVAVMVYLGGLVTMGLVGVLTRRGLSTPLVGSPRANEPILLAGVVMLLFLPLLGWVARHYPGETARIGFGPVHPRSRMVLYISAGLAAGLLISFHFWLTAKTAGVDFGPKPLPYLFWQLCYEMGPQSLAEELFMRGVVFNELFFGRGWNFWAAALAASGLELLSLLVKQDYSTDILVLLGVVFYTLVSGIASAGLFRWSRSVVPGYVNNVVLSVVVLFR